MAKLSAVTSGEIGILQRRRIEAEIIKPLYEAMKAELGAAKAQNIIDKVVREAAIAAGAHFAAKTPDNVDLLSFQELQSLWTQDDALVIEVAKASAEEFDYNVLRCKYSEMYKEMGLGEIGHLLSCNRDGVFCQGYNPDISLKRTQTLMQGASHCDFRYKYKAKA